MSLPPPDPNVLSPAEENTTRQDHIVEGSDVSHESHVTGNLMDLHGPARWTGTKNPLLCDI
eukprot:gene46084-15952_t